MPMTPQQDRGYELFREALAEDEREGGTFDAIGFGQFFPEEHPNIVRDAWQYYRDYHYNRGLVIS